MARLFVVVLVWYGVCVFLQQTLQFHSTLLWTLKWKSHATRVICCTFETCTYGAGSAVHCKFQFNCPIKKSKRLTNLSNVSIFSKMIIGGYGRLQHYLSLKKIHTPSWSQKPSDYLYNFFICSEQMIHSHFPRSGIVFTYIRMMYHVTRVVCSHNFKLNWWKREYLIVPDMHKHILKKLLPLRQVWFRKFVVRISVELFLFSF